MLNCNEVIISALRCNRLGVRRESADIVSRPLKLKHSLAAIGGFDAHRTLETCATAAAVGQKRHFYKPLPTQFRHNGFEYRQIAREGDAAIYEQRWGGCADPSVSYEVIRIRRREGFEISGRFVTPAEVYPNPEAWGVDGFTLTDRDAAFAKLQELGIASGAVGP
jgi:hypothetical protein